MSQSNDTDLDTILQTARAHYDKQEYGKCCSYYLLLFHSNQDCCNSFRDEFITVLSSWIKKLILLKKFEEISAFIQTSLEMCVPIRIDIVLAASQMFYQCEYIFEAAQLLSSCRTNEVTNYTMEENIEQLYNILIDRWHFRMLNDKKRNMAYNSALTNAYEKGHRKVLDIGSGTGIFSLIAFKCGFESVYSCEVSEVMCDIQNKCIDANDACNTIKLINKFSTDLKIGRDLDEKSTLVITEVFDCGLLGEGVLPILIHAWDNLLDVEHGEVIPNSAVVYGVLIECEELRKHTTHHASNTSIFYGGKDSQDERKQPYTTEYMAGIRGGYRKLSEPFIVKSFNFNKPKELKNMIGRSNVIKIAPTSDGVLDAIMVYFSLNIHSSLEEMSTLDKDGLCWEQAVYSIPFHQEVHVDDAISVDVHCAEEYLAINLVKGMQGETLIRTSKDEKNDTVSNNIYTVNRRMVARLNDSIYAEKYKSAILHQVNLLKTLGVKELKICLLCSGISTLPLFVSDLDLDFSIYFIDPSDTLLEFLQDNVSSDRFKCIARPFYNKSHSSKLIFDLVISEPIDSNGLITENYIEDLIAIKLLSSSERTIYIPSVINVHGCCITSYRLLHENRVSSNRIPLNLNIAKYINKYQVNTHPDVNGCSLLPNNTLSDTYLLMSVDVSKNLQSETVESYKLCQSDVSITFTRCGMLTGLMYWFDIVLYGDEMISCAPSVNTHWHQACAVFAEQNNVCDGDKITLSVTRNNSNFHFRVC